MLPRKQRILLTIMIPTIIVIIIAIILMILFASTDIMKPKQELFKKYFLQNFTTLSDITNIDDFNKYDNILKTNNYESNSNIVISSSKDANKKVTFDIKGVTDNINGKDYKNIQIKDDQSDLMKFEYLKNDDIYGLKFENFKQYVSIQNNNLKQIAQNLGLSEDIIQYIPNSVDTDSNIFEKFKFTDEEKTQLVSKYSKIVFDNISADRYSKNKNSLITVDNVSMNTDAYKLTLPKEEYSNIMVNVLEQLKQDEIILSKLQFQSIDMSEFMVKAIEDAVEQIKNGNMSAENISITLYVYKGSLVRTLVETENIRITIDITSNENTKTLSYETAKISETESSLKMKISKQNINGQNQIDIIEETVEEENSTYTNATISNQMVDNTINENFYILQKINNGSFEVTGEKVINFKDVNDIEELNENNNVKLNDLNQEKIQKILSIVSEKIGPSILQVNNSINDIMITGLLEDLSDENIFLDENENTLTEMQIQRFNTQYEVYKGEETKASDVKIMLGAIANNIKDIEVINKNTLKIYVERNHRGDTELSEKISETINDRNTYKIEISYDDNTKLVDCIILTRNVEE